MLESMRWVGAAEEATAGISFDYVLIYSACIMAAVIFACWCCIIGLELYMLCPGWGPIRRFDSDGNEEMRINQLLMHEENQGKEHVKTRMGEDSRMEFLKGALKSAMTNLPGGPEAMEEGESRAKYWEEMDSEQCNAWMALGWTRESWNLNHAPETEGKYFSQLDAKEKAAARRLGYDATSWDQAKLQKRGHGRGNMGDESLFKGFQDSYGAIGKCTWGYCESPFQWGDVRHDPRFGEVVVRHGFSDTQWMRRQSRTWAKDESFFLNKDGIKFPDLTIADDCTEAVKHRMVIEKHRY